VKYFSDFRRKIAWRRIQIPLPPSSAGMGKRLKIARAREIIPAKAR
jgi:hypothetical protein